MYEHNAIAGYVTMTDLMTVLPICTCNFRIPATANSWGFLHTYWDWQWQLTVLL